MTSACAASSGAKPSRRGAGDRRKRVGYRCAMSQTAKRQDLADKIASGLSGWLQMQDAQGLADLPGEDSARFTIAGIVHATGRYTVATSQRPSNWPMNAKQRVDLALQGINQGAEGWYGAIEVKWPGAAFDVRQVRTAIVQDLVRLVSCKLANLNAAFFVLGGRAVALRKLFDVQHTGAAREAQRKAFSELLPRTAGPGSMEVAQLTGLFPCAQDRVPSSLRPGLPTRVQVSLLAARDAQRGTRSVGSVYVWHVNRTRGRRPHTPLSAVTAT